MTCGHRTTWFCCQDTTLDWNVWNKLNFSDVRGRFSYMKCVGVKARAPPWGVEITFVLLPVKAQKALFLVGHPPAVTLVAATDSWIRGRWIWDAREVKQWIRCGSGSRRLECWAPEVFSPPRPAWETDREQKRVTSIWMCFVTYSCCIRLFVCVQEAELLRHLTPPAQVCVCCWSDLSWLKQQQIITLSLWSGNMLLSALLITVIAF